MEMSIDEHIKILKSYHNGFTGWAGNIQDSIDVAVDTMQKYQKILELFNMYQVTHMKKLYLTSGFENALCEVVEGWE